MSPTCVMYGCLRARSWLSIPRSLIQGIRPLFFSPNHCQGRKTSSWRIVPPNVTCIPSQSPNILYKGHE
jgi:hypothetical protein